MASDFNKGRMKNQFSIEKSVAGEENGICGDHRKTDYGVSESWPPDLQEFVPEREKQFLLEGGRLPQECRELRMSTENTLRRTLTGKAVPLSCFVRK